MTEGEFAPFIEGLIRAEEHDRKLLKPCPFCGSDAVFKSRNTTKDLNPRVECTKCTCIVLGVSEDDAIESWNRRVNE